MGSLFPNSIDSFTDPLANSPLNSPSHAGQHQNLNDAVEKIETYMGLVKVTGGTFSGADPLSVTNCFSSTYDHYEVLLQCYGSVATNSTLNFYTGTNTVYNAATYNRYGFYMGSGAQVNFYAPNLGGAFVTNHGTTSTVPSPIRMTIFSPYLSTSQTTIMHKALDTNGGLFIDLMHQVSTTVQFTGFQIDAGTGSITGNYAVYGYRK